MTGTTENAEIVGETPKTLVLDTPVSSLWLVTARVEMKFFNIRMEMLYPNFHSQTLSYVTCKADN